LPFRFLSGRGKTSKMQGGGHEFRQQRTGRDYGLRGIGGREIPLAMLPSGFEGRISNIHGGEGLVRRLIEMGFQLGGRVRVVHSHNPGPVVVEVKDTRIALGRGVAMKIMVMESR